MKFLIWTPKLKKLLKIKNNLTISLSINCPPFLMNKPITAFSMLMMIGLVVFPELYLSRKDYGKMMNKNKKKNYKS